MKVWSIEACDEYEGNQLLGVFATREEAEKAKASLGYEPFKWHIESWEIPAQSEI